MEETTTETYWDQKQKGGNSLWGVYLAVHIKEQERGGLTLSYTQKKGKNWCFEDRENELVRFRGKLR